MVKAHVATVGFLRVVIAALCVRVVGAWVLGEGATFGPDGTGAEAAVELGGHPYPVHIAMLELTGGDARALSMLCSSLSCGLIWLWGRRMGLGSAGGWLAVTFPLSVFPGVLAAGDAPALAVVLLGATLATAGGIWVVVGGMVAALSVAIKPIALAALVLLVARPAALVGAGASLLLLRNFTRPFWAPMPSGGLLGTWWVSSEGAPPEAWLGWLASGAWRILDAPGWGSVWVFWLAALAALTSHRPARLRVVACLVVGSAVMIGALFGSRLELRYLATSFVCVLPFLGIWLQSKRAIAIGALVGLWPTIALLTQLNVERGARDAMARMPSVPLVAWPAVDSGPIFDTCSVDDATRWRQLALQLAEVAPIGSTIVADQLPDGREGELLWPLRVLRPDLKFDTRPPIPDSAPE
ncbi:MAG: hypothetical protein VX944_03975 [Myxococcota bacterium]|nr:hypothetical protein [Myxococcota bacterium]